MDEGYSPDNEGWGSSSDSFEDIDNVALLPEIKRKPNRIRRRKVRFLRDRSFEFSIRRMCSRRTLVYTTITAVLLVSVVLISIFVKPSTSEEFEETKPEKRSQFQDEPEKNQERKGKKLYLDNEGKKFAWQDIRLPTNLVPQKYRVELHPNITTFKFTGTVDMLLKCVKNTDKIFFHAKTMELTNIKVAKIKENADKLEVLSIKKITSSKDLEMHAIQVNDELQADQEYIVFVQFKASLSEKLFGFYKSSYKNKRGEIRYLATTHFEPTDARAAFPCLDEPALKAKFEMILIRDQHYTALSNMPLKKTVKRKDGLLKDYFKETVKMSTYLIAFVVCDFKHLSDRTKSGTLVRVWAPPDDIEQARFALSEAKKILYYYEDFFQVKFPLPKQDLIAIPDFAAGAMENWGLITYRSTSLLYDEKESSDSNKQWVATVVAHELAHQWFGNLVTMKWWNDLWLNEGFASFIENIGANYTNPEWKMMDQFLLDKTQLSMNLDQMSNSHPISVRVDNPNQINSLFDSISYDKGAAIIRMLKNFIGDTAFQHGLQNYLQAHEFSNAETKDLWSMLSKAAKDVNADARDVKEVMDTWTLQMGFPVVTIKRHNGKAAASQKHFLVHPKAKVTRKSKFGYKWLIPLTYRTQKNEDRKQVWMNKDNNEVSFDWPEDSGWLKVNYGQQGFYRVNYEKENWEKLKNQLNTDHKVFGGADKAGLIDDAFNLARAGQLKLTTALDLTLYLVNEKEYVPWSSALNNLGYIDSMLCASKGDYAYYKKYVLQQLTPIVEELGWEDKGSHLQKYLRASVLRLGSEYGHKKATKEAKKMFDEWRRTGKRISPNLRNVVYAIGVREGGEEEFDYMLKEYLSATVASEKRKLMYALTTTKKVSLLDRLLKMSLDRTKFRSQDTVAVITSVAGNCVARQKAWDFVQSNWDELYKRYATGSFDFSRLILRTSSHFSTKEMYKKVKAFFDNHDMASAVRASKQSLESIQANVDWSNQNRHDAINWFKAHTKQVKFEDLEERMTGMEDLIPEEYPGHNDYREEPEYSNERQFARNYYYPSQEDFQNDEEYFRDTREVVNENELGYGRNE
ncbi:glutamyl aminopeptidase-like [Actinia tenebrosa]|uniref:Glutamyl aminopeptidase-like n=1 Tax=Actinia tenebrosa TaxID=6105 RepID=A0A6P8IDN8_ACTTE|nr:glutamyl aminopeptidase-like [Actinia tenebrosa]